MFLRSKEMASGMTILPKFSMFKFLLSNESVDMIIPLDEIQVSDFKRLNIQNFTTCHR